MLPVNFVWVLGGLECEDFFSFSVSFFCALVSLGFCALACALVCVFVTPALLFFFFVFVGLPKVTKSSPGTMGNRSASPMPWLRSNL